jgi:hypothetical protein
MTITVKSAVILVMILAQSPTSHRVGSGSRPGQSMWYLWWIKWHWDRFFSDFFLFFPVNIIPLWHSTHTHTHTHTQICIIWEMNNRPVGGRSSDIEFTPSTCTTTTLI